MAGCTLMLVAAGLLEGYARQLVGEAEARLAIGCTMGVFWLAYFILMRKPAESAS
jgi:hypothetical protein